MTLNLDAILDSLADDDVMTAVEEMTDEQAARALRRRTQMERELEVGRAWWTRRSAALKRSVQWLTDSLEYWALSKYKQTGMKTFPCGTGMARVAKARAKVSWSSQVNEQQWLIELLKRRPELIKDVDRTRIEKECIEWGPPNENGICEATMKGTGECLVGVTKDMRPGDVTTSIKEGDE